MVELRCDICNRLLAPTDREMPLAMKDHLQSVRIVWNFTGKDKRVDLCPKCEKRMIKYLRKEAKMDAEV
jgi:uncharacterized protein with PIN domain